jgi:hypothetical protein
VRVVAGPHDDLTPVKFRDAVYHFVEQVAVVRHDDDRAWITAHQFFDHALARQIEMVVRLVQQKYVRGPHQQAR